MSRRSSRHSPPSSPHTSHSPARSARRPGSSSRPHGLSNGESSLPLCPLRPRGFLWGVTGAGASCPESLGRCWICFTDRGKMPRVPLASADGHDRNRGSPLISTRSGSSRSSSGMRQTPPPRRNMCNSLSQMRFNVPEMAIGGPSLGARCRVFPIRGHPSETEVVNPMTIQSDYARKQFDLEHGPFYLPFFPHILLGLSISNYLTLYHRSTLLYLLVFLLARPHIF